MYLYISSNSMILHSQIRRSAIVPIRCFSAFADLSFDVPTFAGSKLANSTDSTFADSASTFCINYHSGVKFLCTKQLPRSNI
jgi:hypothetical protein